MAELPRFIKHEFDAFLECGSRGARLVEAELRGVRSRQAAGVQLQGQRVLLLPIPLRVLLATQPELVTPLLQVVQRVLTRHLLEAAGLNAGEGHRGLVTLIQRFGSAANLNNRG